MGRGPASRRTGAVKVSNENVEIVRALAERWNTGDRTVAREYLDPAVELESPFSSVVGEPYRGYAGVEQWMHDLDEQFSVWQINLVDVREVGDNRVIAIGSAHARGRASGMEVDAPAALVAHFGRNGRIMRGRIYPDVNEALESVGLEP